MAVPVEWLGNFQVNTGTAATGTQRDSQIIGLANGNFLVAWTEFADGAIAPGAGTDIIGKIYDAEGDLVRDAFRLNSVGEGDEDDFDIAATSDGGFVLVFRQSANSTSVVNWERHNAAGNLIDSWGLADEFDGSNYSDPHVTFDQFTGASFVTYTYEDGVTRNVYGRILDADGTAGAEFDAAQNGADIDQASEVAVLNDGRFVTVYEEFDDGVAGIEFRFTTAAGEPSGSPVGLALNATNPTVAALAGGGFAVAYQSAIENGNIEYRVYDSEGFLIGPFSVASGNAGQHDPRIVALPDGNFVILWRDESAGNLQGFRLLANGVSNGGPFIIRDALSFMPNIGVTGDGRLLFTWQDDSGVTTELFASIWDPRDTTINASDYFGYRNFVEGDIVTGGRGATRINGDDIFGLTIRGQTGNDTITGGFGLQALYGGGGNDSILGGEDASPTSTQGDLIDGGGGKDTIIAARGDDTLIGGGGHDSIRGGAGDDAITGGEGADALNGGGGVDRASYAGATARVVADLQVVANNVGSAEGDTYIGIENLLGTAFNDVLRGDAEGNNLNGASGNDNLVGRAGDDTLIGGRGRDTLAGSGGADRFRLEAAQADRDTITDFGEGDRIELVDAAFGLPEGVLNPARFVLGTTAGDANDRVIYQRSTGKLWFDPDGAGGDAQILIATLDNNPVLAANDFIGGGV